MNGTYEISIFLPFGFLYLKVMHILGLLMVLVCFIYLVLLPLLFLARRVHITDSVLNCLSGDYEVEEGRGQERDPYLKQYNIESYLIVAEHPRVSLSYTLSV